LPYRAFRRNLTFGYLAPFVLAMIVLVGVVLWRVDEQISITGWVEHSYLVILKARDAELEMRHIQLAIQAYMFSPNPRFLKDMTEGQREFDKKLGELASLVTDNPAQEQRLLEISSLKGTWLKTTENLIKARDNGSQYSQQSFDQVRTQTEALSGALRDFADAEQQIRMRRNLYERREDHFLLLLVPALSAAVIVFLGYWGLREVNQAAENFRLALVAMESAKSTAEEASRAKDTFLANISHELRNPLNSILLWSSALLSRQNLDASTARRGLRAIERGIRAQAQLVEDLIDIARIESGRMRLDVQTVNLAEIVKAGVESMRAAAEAKSINVQEVIDPRIDHVVGDPGRLEQVVWNLISNAVKFTPNGGKVQVRLERINSHLEITVADTGQGIEPAALPHIFDRFWQSEGSGQRHHGIGLGLSIVKEIVDLHGGSVAADSQGPGTGSTFTVRLPLPIGIPASTEIRRHPTVTPSASTASAPRLDGASILVVDDDPDACDALRNLLGSLGAKVTVTTSAQDALTIVEELSPDAVVSDIGMPVQDGYYLARELRKREQEVGKDLRTPLVALTAYGRVEDKVQILTAGFDSHAIKPVDPVELSAILKTVIGNRRV
jgi:signal transduction histidine kinase/ActR/RegA family two-component response regulator